MKVEDLVVGVTYYDVADPEENNWKYEREENGKHIFSYYDLEGSYVESSIDLGGILDLVECPDKANVVYYLNTLKRHEKEILDLNDKIDRIKQLTYKLKKKFAHLEKDFPEYFV